VPALEPVPDVVRLSFDFVVGLDQTAGTRLFFRYGGGPPSAADCISLAADAKTAADTNFLPLMVPATAIDFAVVTDLASDTGASGQSGVQTVGTRGGSELPAGVATLTDYEIARRYRGGKPRSYWVFGSTTDLANASTWNATYTGEVLAGVNAFVAAFVGATAGTTTITQHVNVSYFGPPNVVITNPVTGRARNISTRRVPPIVDPITAVVVPSKPSSQRRRYQR
jgi:hypothetical protein